METTIAGFHLDEVGDWVADLACEHGQHMRHTPPWLVRSWVTTAEGREAQVGTPIDCPLCDAIVMPVGAREYKRVGPFTEKTVPAGLLGEHRTKAQTWARIVVSEGQLEYHSRGRMHILGPGDVGIVEPENPHRVSPLGAVRFHVEFWKVE
jgi:tellurite methyltransferase